LSFRRLLPFAINVEYVDQKSRHDREQVPPDRAVNGYAIQLGYELWISHDR
jgi:hypothetical protein